MFRPSWRYTSTYDHEKKINQDEREEDEQCIGMLLPISRRKFHGQLETECTNNDQLEYLRGSYKTRFEICKDSEEDLVYIRAIEGHSGGMVIHSELMNYAQILYKWKHFIYHMDRARDQYSVAEAGLVARGNESKEGSQTTPLDPFDSVRQ